MSAEILREAASLMRERAEAATRGPWFADGRDVRGPGDWMDADFVLGFDACPTQVDADHIASWHPVVALAVADWLEETADHLSVETNQYADGSVCLAVDAAAADCSIFQSALAVARAYLGESS